MSWCSRCGVERWSCSGADLRFRPFDGMLSRSEVVLCVFLALEMR